MAELFNSIYNAVANLGEIKEDDQNKEMALALQTIHDDIIVNQQNESDSEDEETSYDEEDKKILLDKLRQILDEHTNVFVIGPPGSGKSELAVALQAKIG